MNEELQGKLIEILSGIQSATKAAGDFAMEQLPDIAQSYLLYGRVTGTLAFVMWIGLTIGCAYVGLVKGLFNSSAVKTERYFEGDWQDSRTLSAILGGLLGVFSLIPLFVSASNAALVWLAPKVWLLKEFASLVR